MKFYINIMDVIWLVLLLGSGLILGLAYLYDTIKKKLNKRKNKDGK